MPIIEEPDVKLDTSRERPTIAALVVAFVTALLTWGMTALPDAIPPEVRYSGYVLVVSLVAVAVGKAAQGQWLKGLLAARAPWAHGTALAGLAYAASLDPDTHRDELEQLLATVDDGYGDALRRIGIDPDTEQR